MPPPTYGMASTFCVTASFPDPTPNFFTEAEEAQTGAKQESPEVFLNMFLLHCTETEVETVQLLHHSVTMNQ